MTLSEFLKTASVDDSTALSEARAYAEDRNKTISSNVLTMLLVQYGLYGVFSDTANDKTHPARDICLALMDRTRTQSEFDLAAGTPKGDANLQMLDALIGQLMTEKSAELTALKAAAVAEASETVSPFAGATLHDVKLARGTITVKPITQSGGYAVITTTAATEQHNPRLLADNPRTGERVRIESFRGVSAAGSYDTKVPPEWRNAQLYVDDAYGVI